MFKKLLSMLTALLLFLMPALAQQPAPDGWRYMAYAPSGVTFLIPGDTVFFDLTEAEQAAGILLVGGNADYTMQLRRYPAEEMTLTRLTLLLAMTGTAEVGRAERDGVTVLSYRNKAASEYGELFGVALTGTDGCLYKLSIFTGENGDFSESAKVWEIAQGIADSASLVDYSDWPLEGR